MTTSNDLADRTRDVVLLVAREVSHQEVHEDLDPLAVGFDSIATLALPAGSLVCLVVDQPGRLPEAFLGVRSAGLVPTLVDGLLPSARVDSTIDAARPAAVIHLSRAEPVAAPAGNRRALPDGAGYVVFSSGSQGAPKGIVGQASGLVHFVDWEAGTLGIRPGTRSAMLTSPSFDVVLRDLLLPLCTGGELHIAGHRVRACP